MRSSHLKFFVLCFNTLLIAITAQFRFCTTPNGETAHCIPIHSCTKLYNAVGTKNKEQIKFLKESQCGYRKVPLVCCGHHDNYQLPKFSEEFFGDDNFHWGESNGFRSTPEINKWNRRRESNGWNNEDRTESNSWGQNERRTTGNDNWNSRRRENDEDKLESNNNSWNRNEFSNNRRTESNQSKLPDKSSCGLQEGDRILNGQATSLTEFPWMALLKYRKKNGNMAFSCGGTLISSRYVLTAAHCVRGQILTKIGPLISVRLGEYNTETEKDCSNQFGFEICNDKPVDAEIEKVIVHPDYIDTSADRYHDIALIKLKREIQSTDFIKPICLPNIGERAKVGDRLVVAGWGRTENANSSPVKLKLWVPIAEKSQCSNKFKTAGVNIGNKQLCAGGEVGKDSCNGDSGGPLMASTNSAQWYIEGIVSFGAKCGSEGWPGIYTRVAEYMDWIKRNAV